MLRPIQITMAVPCRRSLLRIFSQAAQNASGRRVCYRLSARTTPNKKPERTAGQFVVNLVEKSKGGMGALGD